MLETFYPGAYMESAYEINYKKMYQKGIRGIIFDIDNTLVPHGAPADERSEELFRQLHGMSIRTCLLSNNKKPRVEPFAKKLDTPYIEKAGKPFVKNYRKAMEIMGTDRHSTLFVGDQLFTDVWGANRIKIPSILVKPINPKEEIQIVLKRWPEKIVLFFYKKKKNT